MKYRSSKSWKTWKRKKQTPVTAELAWWPHIPNCKFLEGTVVSEWKAIGEGIVLWTKQRKIVSGIWPEQLSKFRVTKKEKSLKKSGEGNISPICRDAPIGALILGVPGDIADIKSSSQILSQLIQEFQGSDTQIFPFFIVSAGRPCNSISIVLHRDLFYVLLVSRVFTISDLQTCRPCFVGVSYLSTCGTLVCNAWCRTKNPTSTIQLQSPDEVTLFTSLLYTTGKANHTVPVLHQ